MEDAPLYGGLSRAQESRPRASSDSDRPAPTFHNRTAASSLHSLRSPLWDAVARSSPTHRLSIALLQGLGADP